MSCSPRKMISPLVSVSLFSRSKSPSVVDVLHFAEPQVVVQHVLH
jgi:hypothetical protein